jgi:hypothetical protein
MLDALKRAQRYRHLAKECWRLTTVDASTEIRKRYLEMAEHYSALADAEELSTLQHENNGRLARKACIAARFKTTARRRCTASRSFTVATAFVGEVLPVAGNWIPAGNAGPRDIQSYQPTYKGRKNCRLN